MISCYCCVHPYKGRHLRMKIKLQYESWLETMWKFAWILTQHPLASIILFLTSFTAGKNGILNTWKIQHFLFVKFSSVKLTLPASNLTRNLCSGMIPSHTIYCCMRQQIDSLWTISFWFRKEQMRTSLANTADCSKFSPERCSMINLPESTHTLHECPVGQHLLWT